MQGNIKYYSVFRNKSLKIMLDFFLCFLPVVTQRTPQEEHAISKIFRPFGK